MDLDRILIGRRIRRQRELLGLTREQLAELIDVTEKSCSNIESGRTGMALKTLHKIADKLHLSTDYILYGTLPDQQNGTLGHMLSRCPQDKRAHLEQIVRHFLQALEE